MIQQPNNNISRKVFLKSCFACSLGYFAFSNMIFPKSVFANKISSLHKAKYWTAIPDEKVLCQLCPNECKISKGKDGDCHARGNRDGILYSLVHSLPSVITLDEIEKSPLYHFQLNEKVFSIATAGCNLSCRFCQNVKLSQFGPEENETFDLTPEDVINRAKKNKVNSINFFYTEPTIYFEYMMDIAKLAKKEKMKTSCITAGYINDEPLQELIPYIDAFVVGLKGFDEEFYNKQIGCSMEPIKKTIKTLANNADNTWFELVNLLIPGLNDNQDKLAEMTNWIVNETGKDVPLHFTRFEPAYLMKDINPTPINTLEMAYNIGKRSGLNFVYVGNIPGHDGNNTYCPNCGKIVIERVNYSVIKNKLKDSKCSCGHKIRGHWL